MSTVFLTLAIVCGTIMCIAAFVACAANTTQQMALPFALTIGFGFAGAMFGWGANEAGRLESHQVLYESKRDIDTLSKILADRVFDDLVKFAADKENKES